MMTLFRTELRQLLPIAALWFVLELLFYAWRLFTTRLDETSHADLCGELCFTGTPTSAILILIVVLLLIGWNLFPRDSDDGTLAHLQSLAVSRRQIYCSKILAGLTLVIALFAISALLTALAVAANPQSISGQLYQLEWQHLLRHCLFGVIVISHAVLLSALRLVGLILYGAYFALVSWLESALGRDIGAWNLLNLLSVDFYGSVLLTNWTFFYIHGGIALLCFVVGYFLWMRDTANQTARTSQFDSPWIVVPIMMLLFVGLVGYMLDQTGKSVAARNASYATIETEHFRFVHEKDAAPYAEELADEADGLLLEIAKYLNSDPTPRIQTDLTANTSHVAGLAVHNRIRMRLRRIPQDSENRFVLAHETAHVFQSTISNRQLKKVGSSAQFFVEGMAQQVAFTVQPDENRRQLNWLVGAVSADRHQIEFVDLVDAKTFSDRFDAELPYTLGDLWVNTMVEICGDNSMGDFLRIVGADDAVTSLRGVAFWRQHLQRLPCELEDINYRFRERVETLANSETAKEIPKTRSVNLRADSENADTVWLDITVDRPFALDEDGLPEGGRDYILRLRNGASLSKGIDTMVVGYPKSKEASAEISFRLSRSEVGPGRFQYQVGYLAGYDYRSVFDEWENAALPRR